MKIYLAFDRVHNELFIQITEGGTGIPRWATENFAAHDITRKNFRINMLDIDKFIEFLGKNEDVYHSTFIDWRGNNIGVEKYIISTYETIIIRNSQQLLSLYKTIQTSADPSTKQIRIDENLIKQLDILDKKTKQFEDFKRDYKIKYESDFFKRPFLNMKSLLENEKIHSIDDVETYAATKPHSRTATVLSKLKK